MLLLQGLQPQFKATYCPNIYTNSSLHYAMIFKGNFHKCLLNTFWVRSALVFNKTQVCRSLQTGGNSDNAYLKARNCLPYYFRHHSETLLCKGHQKLPGHYNTTRIINWGTFPSRHILRVLARTALLSTQNMILWKSIYNR